jgi:TonB family protein
MVKRPLPIIFAALLVVAGQVCALEIPNTQDQNQVPPSPGINSPAKGPAYITPATPVYPPFAYDGRLQGKVMIRALIDEAGKAKNVAVTGRDPKFIDVFDESALTAVKKAVFSPALDASGRPIAAWAYLSFAFKIRDLEPAGCTHQAVAICPAGHFDTAVEGWVVLHVEINPWGIPKTKTIVVISQFPPNVAYPQDRIAEAVGRSSFKPATYHGLPAKGRVFLKVICRTDNGAEASTTTDSHKVASR